MSKKTIKITKEKWFAIGRQAGWIKPNDNSLIKNASLKNIEDVTIKIITRMNRETNYEITFSVVNMKHLGKQYKMINAYAKDLYLGQYVIDRNYFFYFNNHKKLKQEFDRLVDGISKLRDDYYDEKIEVKGLADKIKEIFYDVNYDFNIEDMPVGSIFNEQKASKF